MVEWSARRLGDREVRGSNLGAGGEKFSWKKRGNAEKSLADSEWMRARVDNVYSGVIAKDRFLHFEKHSIQIKLFRTLKST